MSVNNYKIIKPNINDLSITFPVQMDWDYLGQQDSIDAYEDKIIDKITDNKIDYELTRFSPKKCKPSMGISPDKCNQLNFEFLFFSGDTINNNNQWISSFISKKLFIEKDILFNTNKFKNSFFKLDFYDSPIVKEQKIYLTSIFPFENGVKNNKGLKTPTYLLDYNTNTENYFIYWLKDKNYLNIDTFYVSATYFNSSTSLFTRMANICQGDLTTDKYNLNSIFDFYYKLELDYNDKKYEYFDMKINDLVVGLANNPIKWYEYVSI
jgi:hypothetical protein